MFFIFYVNLTMLYMYKAITVRSLFLRNGFGQISLQRDVVAPWGFHKSVLSSFRAICRKRFHKISEPTVVLGV